MKKKLCAAVTALFILLCCAVPVFAAPVLPEGPASLQVKAAYSGVPLSGVSVSLHRVADIQQTSPWITFSLSGSFSQYPVKLVDLDHEGWAAAAFTLASYAAADGIAADSVQSTGEDGCAVFSDLPAGLYLMQTAPYTDGDGALYTSAPVLLALPAYQEDTEEWDPQAQAVVKLERQAPSGPEGSDSDIDISVRKVWNNGASAQPESVEIELVCEGQTIKSVRLSNDNYWAHTFAGLSADKTYQVVERSVPAGYTVSVSKIQGVYVFTNTSLDALAPSAPGGTKIPQTGVLRWPIAVLAGAGILLFAAGWRLYHAGKKED